MRNYLNWTAILVFMCLSTGTWAVDYYVSVNGDDSNPGTFALPFASLEHALINVAGSGDTIYMRGGSYREQISTANISGTAGNPITIKAYLDEEVTLDGSEPLTGLGGTTWTREPGTDIYRTTINKDIWQLWVDGRMGVVARWPNVTMGHPCDPAQVEDDGRTPLAGTWWDRGTLADMANVHDATGLLVNDTTNHDLAAENVSFAGGTITLMFSKWTWQRDILTHDAGSNSLVYDPISNPDNSNRKGWFKIQHSNALDMPGEWYYDKTTGVVRVWCEDGQSPQGRDVRGKTMTCALKADTMRHVTIDGIHFFSCTIIATDASHVTLQNCTFSYLSRSRNMAISGVGDEGFAVWGDDNLIYNNVFRYFEITPSFTGGHRNRIENCLFHHGSFHGLYRDRRYETSCGDVGASAGTDSQGRLS